MDSHTLYVDLDGTFFKTDLLFESTLVLIKKNPLYLLLLIVWAIKGKAYLKSEIAKRVSLNMSVQPRNPELYAYLSEQKSKGRKIILATASDQRFAKQVCKSTDIFDDFIASDGKTNLSASNKLKAIEALDPNFAYAGNSSDDLVLFAKAKQAIVVNASDSVSQKASSYQVDEEFDKKQTDLKAWVKQLRLYQWVKNCLVFVPLLVSGLFLEPTLVVNSILAFVSFGLLASSTYIVNDLLDLESDRAHARKRNRPLAAARISIPAGVLVASLLFLLAFVIAFSVNIVYFGVLFAYLVLTLSYSFKLKQYIGIDVISLAALYTIRIVAGAAVLGVYVSFWLLAFSMLVFLSLALVKRCAELKALEKAGKESVSGRDYNSSDYTILQSFGSSSSFLSILVFSFYVNNNVMSNQYQTPTVLWIIIPALTYWLMRMWIKTHRGEMHDDPIVFSLKDKGSLITIGFMGVVTLAAQLL
ncbi:UbiA family prenyltransferase [Agaribacter flavus]|uniref:UbiA family prenyltransferase n=1 Tax=Agaribacter flavus TaxID=1902781 RepID=A0ABV7FRG3_9ALTE